MNHQSDIYLGKKVRLMHSMENADVVVVSSKGQVVIPQNLRRKLRIEAKSKLLVYPYSDSLILKKLDIKNVEKELESVFRVIDARKAVEGEITEQELNRLVQTFRHETKKRHANANRSGYERPDLSSHN